MDQDLVIRRRVIGPEDLRLIRELIEREGDRGRSHLSNRLCEIWAWRQANGHFRQIACRDLLRRLEARGLIELPPRLRAARRVGYRNRVQSPAGLNCTLLLGQLREFRDELSLQLVQDSQPLALYRGLVGTYHYLGYQQATGAQLKYIAYLADRPVACLSFGPAAWKVGPRDKFIGWSSPARDWRSIYGHDLALAETFVEQPRFAGTAYAAANWTCVGQTLGRGRNDRTHAHRVPIKTIWLCPLRPDFRTVLGQAR